MKTQEQKIAAAAKILVSKFKTEKSVSIEGMFTYVTSNKFSGTHHIFSHGGAHEIDFGELSDEAFGSLTCKIADAVCAKMRLRKADILHKDCSEMTARGYNWWNVHTYNLCKRIILVRPCKGFVAINRKLKALGQSEIRFNDWYYCDVAGKRSSIFSRHYRYFAEDEEMCGKVLAYLKGKKKVSYDYKDVDDLEDRRRGEYYETEWYGSVSRMIRFTDAKGHQTVIW